MKKGKRYIFGLLTAGGEQTQTLPGGGFHGGEQTQTLPGGGFHGGEQTQTLPGGGFHGGDGDGENHGDKRGPPGRRGSQSPEWVNRSAAGKERRCYLPIVGLQTQQKKGEEP